MSWNGNHIQRKDLECVSWNLEPACESYRKNIVKKLSASALNLQKTSFFVSMVTVFAISYKVKKAISAAIRKNKLDATLAEIQERFCLTPEREDRRLFQLSGERWRASAALGYAENKRIFYAPYNPSVFIIKCVSQLCLNHYMS